MASCAEIIEDYLKKNNYGGLVNEDGECGCEIDDLMPCAGEWAMSCKPGHRVAGCHEACGEGCDFHIVEGKIKEDE